MTWLSLALRNLVFTVVVPGAGGGYVPWLILRRHGAQPAAPHPSRTVDWAGPAAWCAIAVIAVGVLLYLACVWVFATAGRGTPGLWDSPRRVVTIGPYRWVRNPIYLAALLIVSGQAWLFFSVDLLIYVAALAVAFHLFVTCYEERRLRARFGEPYEAYRRTVHRGIPRPPHPS
jgi:protein-S-isoprenylcysteine O-methyltransferase Ste14